ncbi:putative MFS family arabinose efflux permease [Actinoplanes octamycinicus]|uniref:Putative MFS family arabinose efflux permease n=1 Tax=Actinoplanes octamycinicus TaxID=135948 RepID=A0A7W7M694_9ACTN|nr:MFS transporter [Actinoplanes octamycinicus]MBB4738632.1 putative MFS family arabinose efflux permease [Actinoplanes octamycinicus]GIE57758.1 MFS transporter [Actinoplanes octamycinicus]
MTVVAERTVAPARLSRPAAFTAIAAILVTFAAASAVPSPLYVVYQQLWGFSPAMLTVIFAVYVVALIATLLTAGALSDHVGRRPVLAGAILLEAVALVLFLTAGDVSVLLVARIVQGVATGAALSTLGATLIDLNPAHAPGRAGLISGLAPVAGLGLGAFGAGALVEFAPFPTHLVYAVLLTAMVIAGLAVAGMPETSVRRPGAAASLIPRLGVPARLRGDLFALVPIIVASWALGGLYLSLGPSVASEAFGVHDHLLAGLVVALVTGTGAITSFLLRGVATARVLTIAGAGLLTGGALGVAGLVTGSLALATAGTVIAGAGFGAASLASFSTLARIAAPHERGELLAVALTISYAALSIPAVIAGQAATRIGLHTTALWYGTIVAALGLLALLTRRRS